MCFFVNCPLPPLSKSIRKMIVMKYPPAKFIKLGIALGLSLLASSCLQHESTIHLNKDGSGTIVEQTILGQQMIAMMGQLGGQEQADPIAEMFNEEKAKANATKLGEGVEFVKTEIINDGGKKGARVHYKFADINKLSINPAGGLESLNDGEEPNEADEKELVRFKYAGGTLSLIVPPTNFEEMNMDDAGGENAEMEAMAKQMMSDMSLSMKINLPGGIEKTNATYVDGNTITIMDVKVGKMFDQKAAMKKISETAKTDKPAALAEFKKLDGIKMETNENVTISLK